MTETFIHIAMRKYLKKEGWTLVAGEYPGGSDDELFVLSIMNPIVAKIIVQILEDIVKVK